MWQGYYMSPLFVLIVCNLIYPRWVPQEILWLSVINNYKCYWCFSQSNIFVIPIPQNSQFWPAQICSLNSWYKFSSYNDQDLKIAGFRAPAKTCYWWKTDQKPNQRTGQWSTGLMEWCEKFCSRAPEKTCCSWCLMPRQMLKMWRTWTCGGSKMTTLLMQNPIRMPATGSLQIWWESADYFTCHCLCSYSGQHAGPLHW